MKQEMHIIAFVIRERLESLQTAVSESGTEISVCTKHCLSLSKEEVEQILQPVSHGSSV